MKKLALFISTLITIVFTASAQNMQWGFKVLDYSSQKSNKEYAAVQALGMPNAMPDGRSNIKAWEPKENEKLSYIKVGFLNPIKPKQVVIAESFHPGHISQIFLYDADGKEYPVVTYFRKGTGSPSRFLHINTSTFDFYVFAVKLVLLPGDTAVGIDAIGITESDKPYKIKINPNDAVKANMVVKSLGENVNSKYTELGPLVSPDGKTLYFSRRGDPTNEGGKSDQEDIWYSEWDANSKSWGVAKNMGAPLNNGDPNFINSVSPDGNTILLGNSYMPDGTMEDGVSISRRTPGGGWSTPQRLKIEDDSRNISKMANYFMSNSQKILLISNDRKGESMGDRDLYVSFVKPDSTWTKPLNLGPTINTKGTEAAPFLASDERTLYFTSDGLDGYGGSDIYMTRRLDDTWLHWSVPENLGPVVNSSHNESFFTLSASGNEVYFTSQVEAGTNDIDMYKLELPKVLRPLPVLMVYGRVFDSQTNKPVPGVGIIYENLTTGTEIGVANSAYNSGDYQIMLPSGSNYGYLALKEGYASVNSSIDLRGMSEYKEIRKDLYITPLEVDQKIVINNVFFDFDKYALKQESYPELNRIAEILKKYPTMKIEVAGYTDAIGTEAYNDQLSYKRAEAVVNYLITKSGADKNRITLKNFGELKPAATNTTAKGRQLNRRVEFKILSK